MGPSEESADDGPCQPLPHATEVATGFGSTTIGRLGCKAHRGWGRRRDKLRQPLPAATGLVVSRDRPHQLSMSEAAKDVASTASCRPLLFAGGSGRRNSTGRFELGC